MKKLGDYVAIYKEQLEKGDIQKAYIGLIKYVLSLKSHLAKEMPDTFSFGNISYGYLDYTYFPFFNEYLRANKLRFGIVLNHKEARLELWLMGQNAEIQEKYWDLLKTSEWNKNQTAKPKYSFLEVVLESNPDFNDLDTLTLNIEKQIISLSESIIEYLQSHNS